MHLPDNTPTPSITAPIAVPPHLIRSLVAVVAGSLLLRLAASAMGQNIQFYFNSINAAALNPAHPLRTVIGAQVYPISYMLGGVIIGSFFIAELSGALVLGAWSDRYGRKLFILLGPIFGAVAVLITSVTTLVWLLIFTRLLEGLSTASNAPATLGYLAEATNGDPRLRGRVIGFFELAAIGGSGLGFAVGGWLSHNFGAPAIVAGVPLTSPAFALNALLFLASLVVLWFGVQEVRDVRRDSQPAGRPAPGLIGRYWRMAKSPRVAGFAPAWIAVNAVLGIWINLVARILTDHKGRAHQLLSGGFNDSQAGMILSTYAGVFMLGLLLWSFRIGAMKKTVVMLIGAGALLFSCLFLVTLNHQPSLSAPLVLPLAFLLLITILVQSGFTPAALAHLAEIAEDYPDDRGAMMGLYSVFFGLGQFLGSSLGGLFVDWLGADGMILAITLSGLFAAGLLVRLHWVENQAAVAGGPTAGQSA